ncbi:ParM/StbA family protein [Nostoc flagelliforme FACHB-838]|uniref:ParM/StbA family protein n=1 Tax=Nostoc flagelliforme FACHB-838 TaxID=2692904 RepID=A0ABR8E1R1_9NOSO|nr:ParM/StbA family protein [Nostoc flagelliforme]MBD2535046.1 ParM/StbA family protein [Nostoc flagelliforme FACHB-838]
MNRKSISDFAEYTKVVLTLDLGASTTKAIAQVYPDGVPIVITMEPEIADVGYGSIEFLSSQSSVQDNTVWIGIGEEYYVLGALSKSMFAGTSAIRDLKYSYALPKIAALMWLAIRRLGLGVKVDLGIYLQILLPPGEIAHANHLGKQLTQRLKTGVKTPTGKFKCKIRSFNAALEGAGLLTYRSCNVNVNYFQKNIGMLMLGYRNASFTLSMKGNSSKAESTDLGMNWLVSQFVERTAVGLSKEDSRLVKAIVEARDGDFDSLRRLSRKNKPEEIQLDVDLFEKILPLVREEYTRALLRWVKGIAVMDEVLICGGTATFVRHELTQYFDNEGIPICWNGGMELPKYLDTMGLGDRVCDVWGSHISHIKMLDLNLKYDRQDKPLVPDYYVQPSSLLSVAEMRAKNGYLTSKLF